MEDKSIKNPWMYVSVLLGVLLVVSMAFNFSITANLLASGKTVSTGGGDGGVRQVQSPPSQPPAAGTVKMADLVDDDAALGDENAPVTIVEFSDFQCPFCRRSWTQYIGPDKPLQQYIKEGKVKFVYRDFPLSFHPMAQPAAEAAECAEEQGKFWEMHDKIFEEENKLGQGTVQFTVNDIKKWASEIGLNMEQFNSCLDSGKYKQEVQKDFNDGSAAGVSGTPTFFIGKSDGTGQKIVGAQPWSTIKAVIDSYL